MTERQGAPAPTESAACRADRHELCELAGCPCGCHAEAHA